MIETLIQSVGPAALAVGVMWRWLQETRGRADHWRESYQEMVREMQQEAAADRDAYEQLLRDQSS